MQETRQNKIARLLQKELSLIFQEQTRSLHGVMVSVTRTKISPDLSICTAYLSIFPSERGEELIKNITETRSRYAMSWVPVYVIRCVSCLNCDSSLTIRWIISSVLTNS